MNLFRRKEQHGRYTHIFSMSSSNRYLELLYENAISFKHVFAYFNSSGISLDICKHSFIVFVISCLS